jgi:hypothetical protein
MWMAGLAVGCGRVSLREPDRDGGPPVDSPPAVDAAPIEPVIDAAPIEPVIDAAPPEPLDPTLIAWYPLDDVGEGFTVDATGNGRDALCVPACPALVEGRLGRAMAFDQEAHLRVSGEDGSFDTYDGFTVAAWVWLEPPFYSAPLSKMLGTGSDNSWQFEYADDGRPGFTTSNFGGRSIDHAAFAVEPATWVHLAGSWDGFTKRFYVNGTLEYAFDESFVDFDGSDFVIGGDENGGEPALMFGGRMDDVRIYARALADDEIAALAAP